MTTTVCPHEREVLDLVAIEQWPARADAALREHVEQCAGCAEVAAVASAVRDLREAEPRVRVPDASVVWYRAQVRARAEATRRASRPVMVAQGLAIAVVGGVAMAWAGPGVTWFIGGIRRLAGLVPSPSVDFLSPSLTGAGWGMALAVGVWIVVGSVAAYVAKLADD